MNVCERIFPDAAAVRLLDVVEVRILHFKRS